VNLHLDASATDGAASFDNVPDMLLGAGLRPTRRRIALLKLLFRAKQRGITAEILYDEASKARCQVSRATVCSALRQFERAGLTKRIEVLNSRKAWFALDRFALPAPSHTNETEEYPCRAGISPERMDVD
jgi:Fe2+ or Zn2+ uptake regulation protein